MHREQVTAFRRAVVAADAKSVIATLAPDVTFNNPVTFHPFEGLDAVSVVIPPLLAVWQNLAYDGELRDHASVGLVFKAGVGKRDAHGIDFLHFNDEGLINQITVMVRPLTALQALADAMTAGRPDDFVGPLGDPD